MTKSGLSFKVPGGLGNQLFTYFCALYVAQKIDSASELDFSSVDRSHYTSSIALLSMDFPHSLLKVKAGSVEPKLVHPVMFHIEKFFSKIIPTQKSKIFLPGFDTKEHMDEFLGGDFLDRNRGLTVEGYFGDFGFYNSVDSAYRNVSLKKPSQQFSALKADFSTSPFAAVHHRLGDFLSLSDSVGLLSRDYYKSAFELSRNLGITRFKVFTNDLLSSQQIFSEWGFNAKEMQWIDSNTFSDPLENLLLMGTGNVLVASNSTFSFWAGKLASETCTNIFYPAEFRKDRLTEVKNIPGSWIPIKSSWSIDGSR